MAVSQRRKGISILEVSADNEEDAQEFEAQAHKFSLRTERRYGVGPALSIRLFAFYSEEAWRIAAYQAFTAAPIRWTESAEFLHSILLGYTSEQATRWIEGFSDRRASWYGETVFLAMSEKQKAATLGLYSRVLPCDHAQPMLAFLPPDEHLRMRLDAAQLIPADTAIARVSVDTFRFGITLLSSRYTGGPVELIFDSCTESIISKINTYMTSDIQFLTDGRWLKHREIMMPSNSERSRR
jgi:hypothetical protein